MCCRQFLFVLLILTDFQNVKSQESVNYLRNAMWDIRSRLKNIEAKRRSDSVRFKTPSYALEKGPDVDATAPSLSLTKAELSALYEAILNKEQTHADTKNKDHHASLVVGEHNDEDSITSHDGNGNNNEATDDHSSADSNGYYYYYYPLDSFIGGNSPGPNNIQSEKYPHDERNNPSAPLPHDIDDKLVPLYHTHTHEHNVHIIQSKDKKKGMEPLFMAVSSFVGMAVMFILSILFLPKFGALKSRGAKPTAEVTNLIQVIYKAIQGDDCSERVACELGKTAKALKVHDNRFVKLLRRVAPAYLGWYIDGITKYAQTKITCPTVKCRRKKSKTKKS